MKTKIIIAVIIAMAIMYNYFKFSIIWTGEKIDLKENGTIKLSGDKIVDDFFDDGDWLIITSENQRLNWIKSGYSLPAVNFKERFIILSNHKIKALYKEDGCDICTGVPNGFAVYDYWDSEKSTYYIYTMPPIWLSQGVG